jgi:serine protease
MKRSLIAGLLAVISMVLAHAPATAQVVPDEVVVRFKPGSSFNDQTYLLRRTLGLKTLRIGYQQEHIVVEVPKGSTQQALIDLLKSQAPIAYAEANRVTQATAVVIPNDLYFGAMQWNLQSVGGFGIRCDSAWSFSRGTGVKVAVLDTGCAYENRAPYYAAPDLDLTRLIPMTDWVNGDIFPNDDNGHGTFLCTLIAAKLNNRIGGVGVAPEATLMPGKVLDQWGRGRADWMVNGIREAVSKGALVILLGGGTALHSQLLQEAISDAVSRGARVVMGAGNNGANLDTNPGAWAVYRDAMMVGATTREGDLAPYSNYGSAVKVVAPGGVQAQPVWSQTFSLTDPELPRYGFAANGNTFNWMVGTSVAAAHAAGVMALRKAVFSNMKIESGARPLMLSPGGVTREYLLVDAPGALGLNIDSGSHEEPEFEDMSDIRDVGVSDVTVPVGGVVIGSIGTVGVTVRNFGQFDEAVTVTLRDQTTGQTIGTRHVTVPMDHTTSVDFDWVAALPIGTHTLLAEVSMEGDINLANNSLSRAAQVLAKPFAVTVSSYKPNTGDPANGTAQTSFLAGELIGLEFRVTDNSAPAAGASVSFRVIGATGATVAQGTLTADGSGRATFVVQMYYVAGGLGTYRVEATASKNGSSASQTYELQVVSTRAGR